MNIEIEAKIKIDSLEQVTAKLIELGAEFGQEQLQKDFYFDNADAALIETDRCLRLRQQFTDGQEKLLLTYKGAKQKDNFKKRKELEIEVKDLDLTAELLSALGYRQMLVVEKKRRIWQLGGCRVCLDELPLLGSFVEIEGPDSRKIADLQSSLGLANLPHIPQSYAKLISELK
jgi:adenylate cyclase class 2